MFCIKGFLHDEYNPTTNIDGKSLFLTYILKIDKEPDLLVRNLTPNNVLDVQISPKSFQITMEDHIQPLRALLLIVRGLSLVHKTGLA